MSVLVKDMDMPTSCSDCPIKDELCCPFIPGVPALQKEYDIAVRTNRRHSHCPLSPAADVAPVAEIEKIIESLQEQADIYNARAKELLVEEDGQVSQYTWAVSLRETYRRIIKTLDDLIS